MFTTIIRKFSLLGALGALFFALALTSCAGIGASSPGSLPVSLEGVAGTTGSSTSASFSYTFSTDINIDTVTAGTFFIVEGAASASISARAVNFAAASGTCDSANAIPATIVCTDSKNCTLKPASKLKPGTTYTLCISGVEKADGTGEYEDVATTISTEAVTATLAPVTAATAQPVNVVVSATFDGEDAIDESTLTTSNFTLKKVGTNTNLITAVSYNSTTRKATGTHAALESGSSYTATLSGVQYATPAGTVETVTSTFSVTAAAATLSPPDTATDKATDVAITVTFDAPADASTVTTSTITVKKNDTGASLCTSVTLSTVTLANDTATCAHAAFELGTSYTLAVVAGITTNSGLNTVPAASSTFTTIVITTTPNPASGAASVAVDAPVSIAFSGTVTIPASGITLKLNGAGSDLCTSITGASTTKTCVHANLNYGASYTLAWAGITNVTDGSIAFTTVAATSATLTFSPLNGATGVEPDATWTITFSATGDLDLATVEASLSGTLFAVCGTTTFAAGVYSCPTVGLTYGTEYTLSVAAGSSSDGSVTWGATSTTATIRAAVVHALSSMADGDSVAIALDGSTEGVNTTFITATFGGNMDTATFTTTNIVYEIGTLVGGVFTALASGQPAYAVTADSATTARIVITQIGARFEGWDSRVRFTTGVQSSEGGALAATTVLFVSACPTVTFTAGDYTNTVPPGEYCWSTSGGSTATLTPWADCISAGGCNFAGTVLEIDMIGQAAGTTFAMDRLITAAAEWSIEVDATDVYFGTLNAAFWAILWDTVTSKSYTVGFGGPAGDANTYCLARADDGITTSEWRVLCQLGGNDKVLYEEVPDGTYTRTYQLGLAVPVALTLTSGLGLEDWNVSTADTIRFRMESQGGDETATLNAITITGITDNTFP